MSYKNVQSGYILDEAYEQFMNTSNTYDRQQRRERLVNLVYAQFEVLGTDGCIRAARQLEEYIDNG